MVRHVAARAGAWTGAAAIGVVVAALVWHILACTESPIAFSPDGRQTAFVTMEPYEHEKLELAGPRLYRLVLATEGAGGPRVLEASTDYLLTAPGFSPDGKQLAYVRVRLLSAQEAARHEALIEHRNAALCATDVSGGTDQIATQPSPTPATQPSVPPETQPIGINQLEDLALPAFRSVGGTITGLLVCPSTPAELVIRDVKSSAIVSTTPLNLPLIAPDETVLAFTYTLARPQYVPDASRIFICLGRLALAVNPTGGSAAVLGTVGPAACLAPDGRTLAVLDEHMVGLVQTDGQAAAYWRLEPEMSASGLAWADAQTLMLLASPDDDQARVFRVTREAGPREVFTLKLPEGFESEANSGELAVAPAARHLTVSYGEHLFFLSGDGAIVGKWQGKDEAMVQPTFSPDGKRVACKWIVKDDERGYTRTAAIVFFTPDGHEISRMPIPPIDPTATRPATTQPVSTPGEGARE